MPNGIVDGTPNDDLIDDTFVDGDGEVIDGGDATLPGEGPDDDIVNALGGDDVIEAGAGDDEIYGGSGADTIDGGTGDDEIYADGGYTGPGGNTGREVFKWDLAPDPDDGGDVDDGDDLTWGFTQDTGSVTVSFETLRQDPGTTTEFSDEANTLDGIDTGALTPDPYSALESATDGMSSEAYYRLSFSEAVENVQFRINDIDDADQVQVWAWDALGNQIEVSLTGGAHVTLVDGDFIPGNDTAVSNGGTSNAADASHSVLVEIEGPVAQIKVIHKQTTPEDSDISISDVYFDGTVFDNGPDGDDVVDGGDGDDMIVGGGGNDDLTGGDGSDNVDGGDGDDTIDTSGSTPLPDRGFPEYMGLPEVPADDDAFDDRDTVDGGAGNDTITTGDDEDTIYGGSGDDVIDGGLDDDTIDGGADNDTIVGGEGADTIDGGTGDDTIYGGLDPAFPDSLNILDDGSDGNDPDPDPTNGMDVIHGGAGNDVIYGQDDNDELFGDDGDDFIDGGIDEDAIRGGAGNDVLIGGQGADDIAGGDDADDILTGVGDVVRGGEGGDDNDTLIVSGLASVDFDETDPTGESGTITYYDDELNEIGTSEFSEIENVHVVGTPSATSDAGERPVNEDPDGPGAQGIDGVVEGTSFDDVIDLDYLGDPEGDRVDNDDARPPLVGDQDIIVGLAGDDIINGRLDNDLILGGSGGDTIDGNEGDDIVFAGSGDDVVNGSEGNDAIDGGSGDDILDGGEGSDIVSGGDGDDTISGSNGNPTDGPDLLAGGDDDDLFIDVGQGDFVFGGEDADLLDVDVLDLTGAAEAVNPGGTLTVELDGFNPENGVVRFFDSGGAETGTVQFFGIETVIPCFTPGTLIATPKGERRVEDLQVGDRIITRDNGIQQIRWLGTRTLNTRELAHAPHLNPVRIRQGALGNGLPERDMLVSPNHRVLVANDKTALYFDDSEVLVAAKHLTGVDGIDVVESMEVTYIHFMFDQHEVVLSDGAWTESFQPGDLTLGSMGNAQRNEILELFPELETAEGLDAYQSARRSLKKYEAELLLH